MVKDVSGYLADQQRRNTGDLAAEWATIEDLYNKKYNFLFSLYL